MPRAAIFRRRPAASRPRRLFNVEAFADGLLFIVL